MPGDKTVGNKDAQVRSWIDPVILFLGFCLVGYHLYTAGFGQFPPLIQRSAHLGLGLAIAYLQFFRSGRNDGIMIRVARYANIGLALVAVAACVYIIFVEDRLSNSFSVIASPQELVLGVALTFVVIEGARRTTGPFLPALIGRAHV